VPEGTLGEAMEAKNLVVAKWETTE